MKLAPETRFEEALRAAHEAGKIFPGASQQDVDLEIAMLVSGDLHDMETLADLKRYLDENPELKHREYQDFRDNLRRLGIVFELF
jgi:hypothetical protein